MFTPLDYSPCQLSVREVLFLWRTAINWLKCCEYVNVDRSALNGTSAQPVQGSEVEGTRLGGHFTRESIETDRVEVRGRVL